MEPSRRELWTQRQMFIYFQVIAEYYILVYEIVKLKKIFQRIFRKVAVKLFMSQNPNLNIFHSLIIVFKNIKAQFFYLLLTWHIRPQYISTITLYISNISTLHLAIFQNKTKLRQNLNNEFITKYT